jgi:hypothetical protein
MLSRLEADLDLTPAQSATIRQQLLSSSRQMQRERDRAMFQIYLQLLKLHDDLAPSVTDKQKVRLEVSRRDLLESIKRKFPQFLSDPALKPELKSSTDSPVQ